MVKYKIVYKQRSETPLRGPFGAWKHKYGPLTKTHDIDAQSDKDAVELAEKWVVDNAEMLKEENDEIELLKTEVRTIQKVEVA